MSDFFEAVEALRTAQLQKLDHGLNTLKAEHKIIHELAVDRGERLIELARTANAWKDEADALRAENIKLREDLEQAQRQPLYSTRLAADRYRWLRDPDNRDGLEPEEMIVVGIAEGEDIVWLERMDQAIDEARLKDKANV